MAMGRKADRNQSLRIPPHSIHSEQSLLGALMIDNRAWAQVAQGVGVGDFYRREHRLIFAAIAALARRGAPFDLVTVAERMEHAGQLEGIGGLSYLGQICKDTPSAANVAAYARIVSDRARLRELIAATADINNAVFDPQGRESAQVLELARARIEECTARARWGVGQGAAPAGLRFAALGDVIGAVATTRYLIKPYLRADTVTVMFGDSGSYKTFLALHMALSVAHGTSFCGRAANRGAVYMLCGEGHGGIGRRARVWLDEMQIAEPGLFYVSNEPAQLIDEANARAVHAHVAELAARTGHPPALILIDTLSTNFGDGDESFNADVSRLLRNVNQYIRAPFGCCVLIVHHTGHSDKERERGAYAIRANADHRILVWSQTPGVVTMESKKVKDGQDWDPLTFQAREVRIEGLYDSEGEPETSLFLEAVDYNPKRLQLERLGPRQRAALSALGELYEEHRRALIDAGIEDSQAMVKLDDWRRRIEGQGERMPRQQWHVLMRGLEERNLIAVQAPYVRLVQRNEPLDEG